MSKIFNAVNIRRPKYSAFDLSHEKKLSCNMGDLIPVYKEEILPGDKFRVNTEILMRLAPLRSPVMHRVNVYIHYFFVPNRLVYNKWENFITGGTSGVTVEQAPMALIADTFKSYLKSGSLADYLGVPSVNQGASMDQNMALNTLPFRAYQMIYNEYYRDQKLSTKIDFSMDESVTAADIPKLFTLRKRSWEKDYFTSAMLNSQLGNPVNLPATMDYSDYATLYKEGGNLFPASGNLTGDNSQGMIKDSFGDNMRIENIDGLNLTINDLRRATRLQEWLERNNLGGNRYIEHILNHFGVFSSNKSLQRPQYLGGGRAPVVISETLSTVGTESAPQGTMAGHGISVGNQFAYNGRFEEHGYVLGIMSTLPKTAYFQGIDKDLMKSDKFEYAYPLFANLGEQTIQMGEIFYDQSGSQSLIGETFGYQSRYAEYKFKKDECHGDFRDTLLHWHMARKFANAPPLNGSFIESSPTHEIFAVTDPQYHKLYVQVYHKVKAVRPLPYFGTPSL